MTNRKRTNNYLQNIAMASLYFVLLVSISCLILKSTYLIDITKDKLDKNVK
jgi:hypothetical protein